MVGAASLALGAGLSPDEAKAQNKWEPWVAAGGLFGSDQQGELDIFIPLVQDSSSMLFFNAQGLANTNEEQQGSLGLGYRTMVNANWILGINGFFDIKSTQYDHTFLQGGVGLEALSEDFDLRINGHFPESDSERVPELGFRPFVFGNDFGILSYNERALAGVDGEVGYKLPFFNSDPDFEIRVFAGGFYYPNSNPGGQDIAGPKGRVEARLYDLDFLTNGSRLVIGGEVRDDDVRGTEGFGSVLIRMPLSIFSGGAPKLTGLDRRMVDRIERDMIITGIGYQTENVFINNGDAEVGSIFFAADGGTGDGTYSNQDSVADALAAGGGTNSLVVLDPSGGTYTTPGITLGDGQSLVGAGKAIKLTGAYTGQMTYFTPKPAYAGTMPTISGSNIANNLITIGENSSVVNLNLEGAFNNGIFGADLESNFHIEDNVIDLSSAAGAGILVSVVNPVDNTNNTFGPTTPSGFVNWNSIFLGDVDGIEVVLNADDGAAHSFDFIATNNTVNNVDNQGIEVLSYALNAGTSFKLSVDVSDNSVDDTAANGIRVTSFAGGGALLDAADPVVIDGNTVSNTSGDAIEMRILADTGGTLLHTASISDNTIDMSSDDGVYVEIDVVSGSTLVQSLTIDRNTITNIDDRGIEVDNAVGDSGSTATQTFNINDNSLDTIGNDGIFVTNIVDDFAVIDQSNTININDNTVLNAAGEFAENAIGVINTAQNDGTLIQTLAINGNRIDNAYVGIVVYNDVTSGGLLDQDETITIAGNSITDLDDDGIEVETDVDGDGSTAVQTINVDDNVIGDPTIVDDIGRRGIAIETGTYNAGFVDQSNSVNIRRNTITNTASEAVFIENDLDDDGSTMLQNANIDDNTIDGSGNNGIKVSTSLNDDSFFDQEDTLNIRRNTVTDTFDEAIYVETRVNNGGTAYQTVNVTSNVIGDPAVNDDIGDEGIRIRSRANNAGSFLRQDVTIDDNTVNNTAFSGINVDTNAFDFGVVDQYGTITISGNTVFGSGEEGIYVHNAAESYGTITQTLDVTDNTVAGSDREGILVFNQVQSTYVDTTIVQAVDISRNTVMNNAGDGIELRNIITYDDPEFADGTIIQSGDIDDNTIMGNGASGVRIDDDIDGDGVLIQTISMDPNTITGNSNAGVQVSVEARYDADVTVDLTLTDNTIGGNTSDGMYMGLQVYDDATLTFDLALNGNTITGNSDGVDWQFDNSQDGLLNIGVTAAGNTVTGNSGTGFEFYGELDGTSITNIYVDMNGGNMFNMNGAGGLDAEFDANDNAFVDSVFHITDSSFSGNSLDGIRFRAFADDDSDVRTDIHFNGVTAYNNGDDGIELDNRDQSSANADMDVHFANTTVNGNTDDGVRIYNLESAGTADQLVSFGPGGNEVINNSATYDIHIDNNGGTQTVNLTGVTYGTCDYAGGPTIIPGGACP